MNWLKRGIVLGAALICAVCTGASAPQILRADVIYEPRDSFYESHEYECTYEDRYYHADGPNGKLTVYRSPEDDSVIETIENGKRVYVGYIYTDKNGISWGINEDWGGNEQGWFPMDYVTELYDNRYFWKQFGEQIVAEYGTIEPLEDGFFLYWGYPGSVYSSREDIDADDTFFPGYSNVFVDEAGHKWGELDYYYGVQNVWVCIDAPTADYQMLYGDNPPIREVEQTNHNLSAKEIRPAHEGNARRMVLACLLVGAVVMITVILLIKLKSINNK